MGDNRNLNSRKPLLSLEPRMCKESGENKVILFNLGGHGHFDMQAYMNYQTGKLVDTEYSAEEVAIALAGLPVVG
ncbi:hypothetical protein NDI42_00250 [Funiculus sociatus GB2-C1]|uniref:hypothetical protein n=1 Tax=Trichocoleus sp. FACHB-69 TaxID=2692874 RepID=UPI0018EF661C|nr:hypothetical protein [Trichocoleus sp. FACHB-69]